LPLVIDAGGDAGGRAGFMRMIAVLAGGQEYGGQPDSH
jgi:hypothetical protein